MVTNKSNIFRYYFLYLNGGLYLVDEVIVYSHINDLFLNYDLICVKSFLIMYFLMGY